MTDAIKALFDFLVKKEKSGSDYTGKVTRVDGKRAYVQFDGSDITDTPVSLSVDAKPGDSVRVRVADGRAWLIGNDTAPPNDSSEVIKQLNATNAHIEKIETENIVGEHGWINLKEGKFAYGGKALTWDGKTLSIVGKIIASMGQIGNWVISTSANLGTSAAGGHRMTNSLYAHISDGTYEYEVGMQASNTAGHLAFYVARITAGAAWSTSTNLFFVRNTGQMLASSGTIGPWNLTSSSIWYGNSSYGNASGMYFGTSGLSLGSTFKVSSAGVLTATSGSIGAWDIDSDGITSGSTYVRPSGAHFATSSAYSSHTAAVIELAGMTDGQQTIIKRNSIYTTGTISEGGVLLSNKYAPISQSDIRLKDNIVPSDQSGLELINKIELYAFDWKEDGKHQKLGFIADYLEEIDPHLAYGDDIKAVDTFYLQGYEVKAIQELSAKVDEQQKRIDALEAEIAELKALVLQKG